MTRLVQLLARLPGVGEKTAQRFALHLITTNGSLAADLGQVLLDLGSHVTTCSRCGHVADATTEPPALCEICRDRHRDSTLLCIVARVQDLLAIERSMAMRGRYFVLGRLLSPLDGVGPDALPLDRLRSLISEQRVEEVIIATPPSVEGEATALFLAHEIEQSGVKVSRIASGVPHGSDLEFADQITLGRAIAGRRSC
ncbi:MAG TPA: recombination mediator RecR [Polyangiaceae bacterium]|nr:recombination mediator RecR [Polyangiaceae bacterium]